MSESSEPAERISRVSFQAGRSSSDIDPSEARDTLPDYETPPPTQQEEDGQDLAEPEVKDYRASLDGRRERRPTKASCLICFSGRTTIYLQFLHGISDQAYLSDIYHDLSTTCMVLLIEVLTQDTVSCRLSVHITVVSS